MPASQKNLLIGLVSGYDFSALRPFFDTLAGTSFSGDVLFFYDRLAPETVAELEKRSVKLQPFHQWKFRHPIRGTMLDGEGKLGHGLAMLQKIGGAMPAATRWQSALGRRLYHVVNIRFLLLNELLQSGALAGYDRLMLTDVRDVVFQDDPFNFDDGGEVTSFWEHPRFTMATDANYRTWITQAFGQGFAQQHHHDRISCCAVTTGPVRKMAVYIAEFVKLLFANRTPEPFRFGLDSAIHNRLIWEKKIPGMRMLENLSAPVVHLGGIKPEEIIRDQENRLINKDGSVIPLIHQYDRHEEIARQFGGQLKNGKPPKSAT